MSFHPAWRRRGQPRVECPAHHQARALDHAVQQHGHGQWNKQRQRTPEQREKGRITCRNTRQQATERLLDWLVHQVDQVGECAEPDHDACAEHAVKQTQPGNTERGGEAHGPGEWRQQFFRPSQAAQRERGAQDDQVGPPCATVDQSSRSDAKREILGLVGQERAAELPAGWRQHLPCHSRDAQGQEARRERPDARCRRANRGAGLSMNAERSRLP